MMRLTRAEYRHSVQAVFGDSIVVGTDAELDVVGEGVETPDHMSFLRMEGACSAQGFFVCPPISASELADWSEKRMAV